MAAEEEVAEVASGCTLRLAVEGVAAAAYNLRRAEEAAAAACIRRLVEEAAAGACLTSITSSRRFRGG